MLALTRWQDVLSRLLHLGNFPIVVASLVYNRNNLTRDVGKANK